MTSSGHARHHRDHSWTRVARIQLEFTARDHEFTRSVERCFTTHELVITSSRVQWNAALGVAALMSTVCLVPLHTIAQLVIRFCVCFTSWSNSKHGCQWRNFVLAAWHRRERPRSLRSVSIAYFFIRAVSYRLLKPDDYVLIGIDGIQWHSVIYLCVAQICYEITTAITFV